MKILAKVLAFALCLTACGGDGHPLTWGELSHELAVEYCATAERCDPHAVDQQLCTEHSAWHLCNATRDCNAELEDGHAALEDLNRCTEDLAELQMGTGACYALVYFGSIPASCHEVMEHRP